MGMGPALWMLHVVADRFLETPGRERAWAGSERRAVGQLLAGLGQAQGSPGEQGRGMDGVNISALRLL